MKRDTIFLIACILFAVAILGLGMPLMSHPKAEPDVAESRQEAMDKATDGFVQAVVDNMASGITLNSD